MTTAEIASARLRPAVPADLAAIERIIAAAYSPYIARMGKKPGPMLDDYAALIEEGRASVAQAGGNVVGVLVLIPEKDAMLLDNVAVAPEARGTGIGRLMLEHAEDAARMAGYRLLTLYTHVTMTENIALYSRIGFRETHRGEEKGFHRVYMEKALS